MGLIGYNLSLMWDKCSPSLLESPGRCARAGNAMLGAMGDGEEYRGHDRSQEMCGALRHAPSRLVADREDTTMTTADPLITPEPPFLWPEPRVLDWQSLICLRDPL